MSKEHFEDITPPSHMTGQEKNTERSIRNIPVSHRPKTARVPNLNEKPPRNSKWKIWVFALLVLLIVGFVAFLFSRDTSVTIVPRTHTAVLDEATRYTALPDASDEGDLVYTTVTTSFEESTAVTASGVEQVAERASGRITVYNDYSDEPLRLITQTRFETPGGLVYRVQHSVDVPGRRTVNGTVVPGSIDITVFADEAGERHNIEPVDRFTLPGLDGTDMFDAVYARSATPMTGGFIGERPVVSEEDKEAAEMQLQARLSERVASEVQNATPEAAYPILDLATTSYTLNPPETDDEGAVNLSMETMVSFPVFDQNEFAYFMATNTISDVGDNTISFVDPETFTVRAIREEDDEFTLGQDPITYAVSGTVSFIWDVDLEEVASSLIGREESAFESVISSFSSIERAEARIRPFWRSTFPQDASKIIVALQQQ